MIKHLIDRSVRDEQRGFKKGRGCMDQIFALNMMVGEYLEKDRKTVCCFHRLGKNNDKEFTRGAHGTVLRI